MEGRSWKLKGEQATSPPPVLHLGHDMGETTRHSGQYEIERRGDGIVYQWTETRAAAPALLHNSAGVGHPSGPDWPRVLSCKQPWAHAIIHGTPPKDVENRSFPTPYRGQLYIHASMADDDKAPGPAWAAGNAWHEHAHGAIIGHVQLVDCKQGLMVSSPWAEEGAWHWQLANPVALKRPLPIRGRLNVWRLPEWAMAALADLELTGDR